jgi:hypothetical protein
MNPGPEEQARVQALVDDWAKDKREFPRVRYRMGQFIQNDIALINAGFPGLGTVRDGRIDLDHAYELSLRTDPGTLAEIRAAKKREQDYVPPQEKRDPGDTVRQSVLRSIRELKERG